MAWNRWAWDLLKSQRKRTLRVRNLNIDKHDLKMHVLILLIGKRRFSFFVVISICRVFEVLVIGYRNTNVYIYMYTRRSELFSASSFSCGYFSRRSRSIFDVRPLRSCSKRWYCLSMYLVCMYDDVCRIVIFKLNMQIRICQLYAVVFSYWSDEVSVLRITTVMNL